MVAMPEVVVVAGGGVDVGVVADGWWQNFAADCAAEIAVDVANSCGR